MPMSENNLLGPMITVLLMIISALLTYLSATLGRQFRRLEELVEKLFQRLGEKVDNARCEERRRTCELDEFGSQFWKHRHTGLPSDSILYVKERE